MDLRHFYPAICFLLQMFVYTTSSVQEKDCRLCKPGYYATRICSDLHDTVCSLCPRGRFTSVSNVFSQCTPCSKCDQGEYIQVECSKHSDTVCESCSATVTKPGSNFFRQCFQSDQVVPGLGAVGETADNGDVLSSEQNLPKDVQLIEEGSGVSETLPEDTGEHKYKVVNATEEEVEGSGETVIIDPTEEGANATKVILPDLETNRTATVDIMNDTKVIVGEGIDLSETTQSTNVSVDIPISPDIAINLGKPGIDLATNKPIEEPVDNIDVYIPTTPIFEPDNDQYDHQVNDNTDHMKRPLAGASHDKSSEEKSGVSVGVVVTVALVAALVFFILGFIANRIWSSRRDRSFNVQEAERRNGSAVECSKVEYKDPESQRTKGNLYGEMPTDPKQNGRGGSGDPANKVEGPIYTKPLKRNSVPPKDDKTQAAPGQSKGGKEKAVRPPSEIKYMDEEAEEAQETEKLLAQEQPHGSKTTPKSSQNGISDKHGSSNGDIPDEKTPMINNQN